MNKSIGLPFKSELVPKVLSGEKTQTRRLPGIHNCRLFDYPKRALKVDVTRKMRGLNWDKIDYCEVRGNLRPIPPLVGVYHPEDQCYYYLEPRHEPGDIAWMRETFCDAKNKRCHQDGPCYRADKRQCALAAGPDWPSWKPSIHLPRKLSRKKMILTNVRIELIQDISEEDAIAEGIEENNVIIGATGAGGFHREINGIRYESDPNGEWEYETAVDAFAELWDSINATRGWAWKLNRPVVVYEWSSNE